ncbi:HD domain-containing protein [Magnetospirillum sp. 15-1]|uniref:HD-GYP domain-containing protein n=1 Tax=Magnetospirillum sp. 15-1 TaxID=1979370 RepID=UPI0014826A99|nr:HD domain-containing protein [Magnetospirillum sp. 15-1]
MARTGQDRVTPDLSQSGGYAQVLSAAGMKSAWARPLFDGPDLLGFLFLDATVLNYFNPNVVADLQVFADLTRLIIIQNLTATKFLRSVVKVSREFSRYRDEETGMHLERMSHYAQEIARGLAPRFSLSDEYVAFVHLFAPLHDIGKVAIPDHILLKPGKYEPEEFLIMKNHSRLGAEMIDRMAETRQVPKWVCHCSITVVSAAAT